MLVGLLTMRIENFGKLCMEVVETSVHQLTPGHLTLRQIPHFGAYLKFLKVILVPFFSLITVVLLVSLCDVWFAICGYPTFPIVKASQP